MDVLARELGDGVALRALEPWRAAEFAAHVARAREYLAAWLPWARTVVDEVSAAEFLGRYARSTARDGGRIYGIWEGTDLVGGTLFRIFDTRFGVCELGVWLVPEAQGRGLVTRASRAMIDWAVRVRGMARVEWRAVAENTRSIAVARRLGMTRDGVLRKAFPSATGRSDVEVWSLLAEEWTGR